MNGFLLLLLLIIVVRIWYGSAKVRESAIDCVAETLQDAGLQLLDGSICLHKIWPTRMASGHIGLLRFYYFEYTTNGVDRHQGLIVMAADNMECLQYRINGQTIMITGDNNL